MGGGGGRVAFPMHDHGGIFALKGSVPSQVFYLAGTEEEPILTECV